VRRRHGSVQPVYYHRADAWRPDYPRKVASLVDGIVGLMSGHGVRDRALAVDELDVGAMLGLDRAGITLVDSLPVVEKARSVKTQDEIAIYRDLAEKYAHVFNLFRENIRPGITEKQLEALVLNEWTEIGGDGILQINVCSGENMNPWRRLATQRPLQAGEFVGIDFHGRVAGGMLGDTSRTFLVGDAPTPAQRDLYRQAWEYVQAVAEVVRAGRSFADFLELLPPVPSPYQAQQSNYHVVHSVGIVPQTYPKIDRDRTPEDDVFRENQILSIECFFGEVGSDVAVKLEEMVLVRTGPAEFITAGVPYETRIVGNG
jgi:Xaa-Pro aminopeptidase